MTTQLATIGNIPVVDIPGYEGLYAVSADGRVWAYPRTWLTGMNYQISRVHSGKWLSLHFDNKGYVRVSLKRDGKSKSMQVHRLVGFAWLPNPDNLPEVNHLDAIKNNNKKDNLEWCTKSRNRLHAFAMGRIVFTDAFRAAVRKNVIKAQAAARKLTFSQARKIRALISSGKTKTEVASSFGVSRSTVWAIVEGKTYVE